MRLPPPRYPLAIACALLALLHVAPANASYESHVAATPGLLSFWQLDEPVGSTVGDLTNAAPLALSAGSYQRSRPSLTSSSSGHSTQFTTARAVGGDVYDFDGNAPFSAAAWVRTSTTSADRFLVSKWGGTGWVLYLSGSSPNRIILARQSGAWPNVEYATTSMAMQPGVRHHVAATYDGSTIRVYIDGRLGITRASSRALPNTTEPLAIGARANGTSQYNGDLDDVSLYDRALSATEVEEHYAAGKTPSYAQRTLDDTHLGAYMPLNEISGTNAIGRTGTVGTHLGGVTLGEPGLLHQAETPAARFDGVDDYVSYPDDNSYDVTSAATVEAWVRLDSIASGGQTIVEKGSGYVMRVTSGGNLRMTWYQDATSQDMNTTQALVPGRTHHVLATYAAGGERRLYVDGTLVASAPASGDIRATATALRIGSATQPFDGVIDEVAIFGRELSASDVLDRWRAGADITAPAVTFNQVPPALGTQGSATFTFTLDDADAETRCRLDGATWITCTGTYSASSLTDGPHVLEVETTNRFGATGVTTHTWHVDRVAPIVSFNADPGTSPSGQVGFSSNESADLQCALDDAAWTTCTSPFTYSNLSSGEHLLRVRAIDVAGNASAAYDLRWKVARAQPQTSIVSSPPTWTNAPRVQIAYTSDVADATFQCRLDEAGWTDCARDGYSAALDEGAYAFQVRAVVDGVADETPATRAFVVDRTAPRLEIVAAPDAVGSASSAAVLTSVDDPQAEQRCVLNGAAIGVCGSRVALTGLRRGQQRLSITARDRAGNESTRTVTWETGSSRRSMAASLPKVNVGRDDVRCDTSALPTGVKHITFLRNGTPVDSGEEYERTEADDGARLSCRVKVEGADGTVQFLHSSAIVVDGSQRVGGLKFIRAKGQPSVRFHAHESGLVLVRIWCRDTARVCSTPSQPTDHDLTARSSKQKATNGLRKYRRVLMRAAAGSNTLALNRLFPEGTPAADYKVTLRIAHRRGARLRTSAFIATEGNVTARGTVR